MKKINIYSTLLLLVGVLFFYSCSENTEYPETRLFRPVLNSNLVAQNNTITVDLAKMTKAISYKIELSRDNFVTVLATFETTSNKIVISNLLWNKKYYVRATAVAATTDFDSKVSDLGNVTTDPFPSIMLIPTASDVTDIAAKMKWLIGVNSGAPITQVKVFASNDEYLLKPLFTYDVTTAEQLVGEKIINGLIPSTSYQLAIFSGSIVRGWKDYITRDPLPVGSSVVDLRGIAPTTTTLFDALTNAPAGATVILDGDQKYSMTTAYFFNKSLTIKSGYSISNTTGAIIDFSVSGEFGLAASGNIDLIAFDGVSFTGTTARYAINVATAASTTVGELKFVNCKMTSFRDIIRTRVQWTSGGISLFTVDNCIVADISSNGLVIVDATSTINPLPNIVLKNSTFSKVVKLINNRSVKDSNSLIISDCTFCESPTASQILEYTSTTNILQGIKITNTIFGRGGDNAGNYDNSFVKSGNLPATTITSANTYKTNDFVFTPLVQPAPPAAQITTPVPAFTVYAAAIKALWVDPLNRNFYFLDSAFPGTKTSGDPRWRK